MLYYCHQLNTFLFQNSIGCIRGHTAMNEMLCTHMSLWVQELLYHMWKIHIFGHELILLVITSTNFCCSNIASFLSSGIGLDFSLVLLSKEILISQFYP